MTKNILRIFSQHFSLWVSWWSLTLFFEFFCYFCLLATRKYFWWCQNILFLPVNKQLRWDIEKKHTPKMAFFGYFSLLFTKFEYLDVHKCVWSYIFLKVHPGTYPFQKNTTWLKDNWLSNNYFRTVSAKCSSDLRPCPNVFLTQFEIKVVEKLIADNVLPFCYRTK